MFSQCTPGHAQFRIKGTVYDSSRVFPVEAVSVQTTSGNLVITDADGHYEISVKEKDSIWFSYLGKPTMKFPVLKITDPFHFDLALQVNITVLKEVKVRQRNYKQDSIQNRLDYAKAFDFEKPKLKPNISTGSGGVGVGFDLDEIIRMFQFRKNKSMLKFQQRLIQEEQDKFIDHRFNRQLVKRLTDLPDDKLQIFMSRYRPDYYFTLTASDYEFQLYIKKSYKDSIDKSE